MRALALYVRSRNLPATAAGMMVCAVGLWALGVAIDHRQGRTLAALLVALGATTIIGPGLAGADHDLDRASAIAWPPRRAAHLMLAGTVAFGLLAATALAGQPMAGAGQLARNVAGLTGLVGLGTAIAGAARAAALPVLWTVLVLKYAPPMGQPPTRPTVRIVLTWMVQPATARAATLTAVALAAAGTLAYAIVGSRRVQ